MFTTNLNIIIITGTGAGHEPQNKSLRPEELSSTVFWLGLNPHTDWSAHRLVWIRIYNNNTKRSVKNKTLSTLSLSVILLVLVVQIQKQKQMFFLFWTILILLVLVGGLRKERSGLVCYSFLFFFFFFFFSIYTTLLLFFLRSRKISPVKR